MEKENVLLLFVGGKNGDAGVSALIRTRRKTDEFSLDGKKERAFLGEIKVFHRENIIIIKKSFFSVRFSYLLQRRVRFIAF